MSIETDLPGSPGSLRGAADWLHGRLAPAVRRGADALVAARREAGAEWRGETGEAFCGAVSRAATASDEVEDAVRTLRGALADYAGVLEHCQHRMTAIREEARAAGLTVTGTTVQPPGEGPPPPGGRPAAGSAAEAAGQAAAVAAYDDHQQLLRVYRALLGRAEDVWRDLARASERLSATDRGLAGPGWTFTLTDVLGSLVGAGLARHGSILRGSARYFGDLAASNLGRLGGRTRVANPGRFYADLDFYGRMGAGAADDAATGARFLRAGRVLPLAVGGTLTGVGIWYDMARGGESAGQAVTSNVGGFAASVAAGALVGTAVGGPVGTVAGMVVGAGVGIFTSGMIDGLWESGGDLGDAVVAGADSVADTGETLLDVASDLRGAVVEGVGGLFG